MIEGRQRWQDEDFASNASKSDARGKIVVFSKKMTDEEKALLLQEEAARDDPDVLPDYPEEEYPRE